MPPRRRNPDLGRALTFGGRVPPSVGFLVAATAIASIAGWLDRGLGAVLAFDPRGVVLGQVWRLVTWVFVQNDPLTLFFVGLMLWWLGPQLIWAWGEKRFVATFFGITVGAALMGTAVGLVWEPAAAAHIGGWPTMNALLVVWALLFPDRQLSWFGVLNMTARTTAIVVAVGTVLWAIAYGGPGRYVLHFAALGLGWLVTRGISPGAFFRSAQRRMQDRDARRRAKHLKVIRRNGGDDHPRWMN